LVLALLLPLLSCLSCDSSLREPESYLTPSGHLNCGLEGFTEAPAEHIINEITEPFVVREVKGRIDNVAGPGWWKDCLVLFEIRGIRKDTEVHKVYADENGKFIMRDITEGRYCFKATVNGWQSVMGVIFVEKRADPQKEIVFEMQLGVRPRE
jgi:hypothetical protein